MTMRQRQPVAAPLPAQRRGRRDAWRAAAAEPPAPPRRRAGELRVTYLGVSTLLLDDGETAVLTDGFFTRPGLLRTLTGRVRSDPRRIGAALARAGITTLDAVFVVHSHYDHALDAAAVAAATGARLLGSESTRAIARGRSFPEDRFDTVRTGEPLTLGRFTLTPLPARHSPGDIAPGAIERPLPPTARLREYRTGECYSLHVRHRGAGSGTGAGAAGSGRERTLLVHASANYLPDVLADHPAETVYLGIGALGRQTPAFRERYWHETVVLTDARRVVPIHWDDFTRALDRPLRPLPRPFDDVAASLAFLRERAALAGIAVALPLPWQPTDPHPAH